MKILSIETSCDETAISIMEATGDFPSAKYTILGNALFSQIDIHREYGGVFPAVAKREHARTLVPMLEKALEPVCEITNSKSQIPNSSDIKVMLEREPGLYEDLIQYIETHERPDIDLIAVTYGPGLEPTLWVGVNFAKALALLWNIPVVGVNHMEGHVLASLVRGEEFRISNFEFRNDDTTSSLDITNPSNSFSLHQIAFPSLALLISGGHTELIKMTDWSKYEKIGQTRDDAVGEAFDKVARSLGLPYPGGPEIGSRAGEARATNLPIFAKLPRPMLNSDDLDFSFSGLKTSVRHAVEGKTLSSDQVKAMARDFEDAVTEVLLKKTITAIEKHNIQSLIIGGGVSCNEHIRNTFQKFFSTEYPNLNLYLPDPKLSTDNSIMIALAGHARATAKLAPNQEALAVLKASGNLSLAEDKKT